MHWSPHVALVTMVSSDHLDWHGGSVEAYGNAKENLVRFQRSYQASARAMSTLDEMLDVLINRTGRVGL